jgi:hypothetical protein
MKKADWTYFAGLFDGEGSVTISQCTRKTATKSCRAGVTVTNQSVRISNNNPVPLLELEEKFGGRVRFHSKTNSSYVWICQGYKEIEFVNGILPYSRIKRQQLEIYLAFAKLKRRKAMGKVRLTKDELSERRKMISKLDKARKEEGGKLGLRLVTDEAIT